MSYVLVRSMSRYDVQSARSWQMYYASSAPKLKRQMRTTHTYGLPVHVPPPSRFTGCNFNDIHLLMSGSQDVVFSGEGQVDGM